MYRTTTTTRGLNVLGLRAWKVSKFCRVSHVEASAKAGDNLGGLTTTTRELQIGRSQKLDLTDSPRNPGSFCMQDVTKSVTRSVTYFVTKSVTNSVTIT